MPELTVASFNLQWGLRPRWWGYEPYDVVEACGRLDADVLILQESWAPDGGPAQHDEVAAALGMTVAGTAVLSRAVVGPPRRAVARGAGAGGDGGWHLAALSRVPIAGTSVLPLRRLWRDHADRCVLAVEVVVDGVPLHVRGTHLPHLENGVHLTTPSLRRALPPASDPGVLLGDMNMWGWSLDPMLPAGWRRVVRGKTWPSRRPHSQIDHIVVTEAVEAVWTEVGPDLGSDHLPVRARLRWGAAER